MLYLMHTDSDQHGRLRPRFDIGQYQRRIQTGDNGEGAAGALIKDVVGTGRCVICTLNVPNIRYFHMLTLQ